MVLLCEMDRGRSIQAMTGMFKLEMRRLPHSGASDHIPSGDIFYVDNAILSLFYNPGMVIGRKERQNINEAVLR